MRAIKESLGSESNQESISSESNQESLGSESNQISLGGKMWPSDHESLGSKQLAERSGSLGWKYWSSKYEVLAGSTGQASKEAQRTAGDSIITDEH